MLATDTARRRRKLLGSATPRIAPPTPAKADVAAFVKLAAELGLDLFPWQQTAARYLTAKGPTGHPLYREIAVVVARQNGKTRLLLPLIVQRLLEGRRVMHAAQNLRLPAEFHRELAEMIEEKHPDWLPPKRGISWRAGQESIRLRGGGFYQIVAATGGAPRGPSNDLVIIDEVRELENDRFLGGVKPTMIAKPEAQIVYLSNAGTDDSAVLNAIRARGNQDPKLAYLEWSTPKDLAPDDTAGWLQANPSIGHLPGLLENLEDEYRAALLGGTMATFETEHLCRWVPAMTERLVRAEDWVGQEFAPAEKPARANMAVKMDPSGTRASAVIAWAKDEKIVLSVHDTVGSPIDVSLLGPDLAKLGSENRVVETAFDPYTDTDLVRYLKRTKPISGKEYASASEKFARLVAERRFRIDDPDGILGRDLEWTTRKPAPFGTFSALRASDEHSTTAAEAAVRAAWLASTRPVANMPRLL